MAISADEEATGLNNRDRNNPGNGPGAGIVGQSDEDDDDDDDDYEEDQDEEENNDEEEDDSSFR